MNGSDGALLLVLLGTAAGCVGPAESAPTYSVTDSAGVRIVRSHQPAWEADAAWTLAVQPALEIGAMEGEEPYLLDRVMGVARLADGGVAVAMMGDNTVRFYDAEGRYASRFGGTGEGPREFRQITGLARGPGRIYVLQYGLEPIRIFDERTGELQGEVRPPRVEGFSGASGIFADGSLLYVDWPNGMPLEQGVYTRDATVARVTPEGEVDTVGVFPGSRFVAVENRFANWQEYGPSLQVHAGQYLYHAFNEDYDIAVRAPGGDPVRRIRRDWEPVPVTDEDEQRHRDGQLNLGMEGGGEVPPRLREQRQRMIDAAIYPTHHVAHEWMLEDREGNLWVRRTKPDRNRWSGVFAPADDTPTGWDVFDPEGVWLGVVETPARFRVMEIGSDYVAGVWRNELSVEFVRVHALVKPGR